VLERCSFLEVWSNFITTMCQQELLLYYSLFRPSISPTLQPTLSPNDLQHRYTPTSSRESTVLTHHQSSTLSYGSTTNSNYHQSANLRAKNDQMQAQMGISIPIFLLSLLSRHHSRFLSSTVSPSTLRYQITKKKQLRLL